MGGGPFPQSQSQGQLGAQHAAQYIADRESRQRSQQEIDIQERTAQEMALRDFTVFGIGATRTDAQGNTEHIPVDDIDPNIIDIKATEVNPELKQLPDFNWDENLNDAYGK